jgi:hypothetical protein
MKNQEKSDWQAIVGQGNYIVILVAKKNNCELWNTETLENAKKSIDLFVESNPDLNRTFAKIYKISSQRIVKRCKRKNIKFENILLETITLKNK